MEYPAVEHSPVVRRLHSLDHAFVSAEFSNISLSLDRHDCMAAARSFWGDELSEPLPNLAPPATSVVVEELRRGEGLRDVPLPYLWQTLQTLRGVRTPNEVQADRAAKVVRVASFVPELAIVATTKLIGLKAPGIARAIDVVTTPFTHADDIARGVAKHSREELTTEVHRLVNQTFSESFYRGRDLAPWLVVHIMRRIVAVADQGTLRRASPILINLLEETFYASSRRTAFRAMPNLEVGHKQTEEELAKEQLITQNPVENLMYHAKVYGLRRAMEIFVDTRRSQKAAYAEAQRKAMRKGFPDKRVRPDYAVEAQHFRTDVQYAQLVHDPYLLVKIVEEYVDTETPPDEQIEEMQQTLAALAELSHLPVGPYRRYGFDYSDGTTRRFLAQCGVTFAVQLHVSQSLGRARLLADATSSDAAIRARSPYAYLRPSRLHGLLDDLQREAMRHFNMDPSAYSRQHALQDAMVEAYIYQRTRRGDLPSDSEVMAEVETRRAKRFLKAIDGIDGVPIAQLKEDIRFAKRQRSRMSRAARKHVRGFFSG